MARRNVAEACIICEKSPCACNKKPQKTAAPRLVIPQEYKGRPQRERLGLVDFRFPALTPKADAPVLDTDTDRHDREMSEAITTLVQAGLIPVAEDIEKHRHLIKLTDAEIIQIRANEWKLRRERRGRNGEA